MARISSCTVTVKLRLNHWFLAEGEGEGEGDGREVGEGREVCGRREKWGRGRRGERAASLQLMCVLTAS